MKNLQLKPYEIVLTEVREPNEGMLFQILRTPKSVGSIIVFKDPDEPTYLVLDGNNRALAHKVLNKKVSAVLIEPEDFNEERYNVLIKVVPKTKYPPFNKYQSAVLYLRQGKIIEKDVRSMIDDFKIGLVAKYKHFPNIDKTAYKELMDALSIVC